MGITQCQTRESPLSVECSRPVESNVVATARENLPSLDATHWWTTLWGRPEGHPTSPATALQVAPSVNTGAQGGTRRRQLSSHLDFCSLSLVVNFLNFKASVAQWNVPGTVDLLASACGL